MKRILVFCTLAAGTVFAASPTIRDDSVSFQQVSSRNVTIGYVLDGAPAIVTVDILTNGISIGEAAFSGVVGAINKVVYPGANIITWNARAGWPDRIATNVTVKVTAWPTNAPPDYCVVDLMPPYDVRYYVSTNALPDGGLANRVYCRDKLVLRRIHAAGETFRMGQSSTSYGSKQMPHMVQLSSDYYMSIYTLTVKQYNRIAGTSEAGDAFYGDPEETPIRRNVALTTLRGSGYTWPQDGHAVAADSVLGTLRSNTGLDFDLPTDAQWEFACRAGTKTRWSYGTGSGMSSAQKMEYGWVGYLSPWVSFYGTTTNATTGVVTTNSCWAGSHPVGLLKPNPWGMYDMHGNVWETCLDYFVNATGDWGWVSRDHHDPVTDPMGVAEVCSQRVGRGGSYSNGPEDGDSSMRHSGLSGSNVLGIRLVCPALATR